MHVAKELCRGDKVDPQRRLIEGERQNAKQYCVEEVDRNPRLQRRSGAKLAAEHKALRESVGINPVRAYAVSLHITWGHMAEHIPIT